MDALRPSLWKTLSNELFGHCIKDHTMGTLSARTEAETEELSVELTGLAKRQYEALQRHPMIACLQRKPLSTTDEGFA